MNFIVLLDLVPCKKNFRIIGKKERDVEKISMKKGKRMVLILRWKSARLKAIPEDKQVYREAANLLSLKLIKSSLIVTISA